MEEDCGLAPGAEMEICAGKYLLETLGSGNEGIRGERRGNHTFMGGKSGLSSTITMGTVRSVNWSSHRRASKGQQPLYSGEGQEN